MDEIKNVYQNSGYPSAARLWALVKDKGLGVTQKQVKDFVDSQTVAQVHKKAPVVNPIPITVSGANVEFQMDLLDMSQYSRTNGGLRWILILEDIFNRKGAAVPLKTKSPTDVLPALQIAIKELGQTPVQLVSDSGSEWLSVVKSWLQEQNIIHRTVPVNDHHSLGIIDSFARFVKNAIAKHMTHTNSTQWVEYLDPLIQSYNALPNSTLKEPGKPALSPIEAEVNETATRNIHVRRVNEALGKKKFSSLAIGDYVRVLKTKMVFSKGYESRWSIKVYKIEKIEDGHWFVLNDGRRFREGSLQKINNYKPQEEQKAEPVKDVAHEAKKEHRVEQILKHQEGVSQSNRREGLRERKPENQLIHQLFGKINW